MRHRGLIAITSAGLVWALSIVTALTIGPGGGAQPAQYGSEQNYGYGSLTDAQRAGRDTWYFWTGGNEKFWVRMA